MSSEEPIAEAPRLAVLEELKRREDAAQFTPPPCALFERPKYPAQPNADGVFLPIPFTPRIVQPCLVCGEGNGVILGLNGEATQCPECRPYRNPFYGIIQDKIASLRLQQPSL